MKQNSIYSLIISAVTILLFFLLFPVLIVKSPYKVSPSVIEQGELFTFEADYCKLLPLPSSFQIVYVGENAKYFTPEQYSSNVKSGCKKEKFQIQLPEHIPTGTTYFELNIKYPFFIRTFTFGSEKFEVVPGRSIKQGVSDILDRLNEWEVDK